MNKLSHDLMIPILLSYKNLLFYNVEYFSVFMNPVEIIIILKNLFH